MKKIEAILEIDKIKDFIASYAKTPIGKETVYSLKPTKDFPLLQKELNDLSEMMKVNDWHGDVPIFSELDLYQEFERIKKGELFDEVKLNLIKSEIQNTVEIVKYSMNIDEELKYLNNIFFKLKPNEYLYSKIASIVTPSNEIKDTASKRLSEIRSQLAKMNQTIHKTLSQMLSRYKDKLSGDNYVIRNGRFSIPVSTGFKASVDGIVQDVSDSGQTTFIEPREVLELENQTTVLRIEEREEINKILRDLTREIMNDEAQLTINNETIGRLDFLQAKAKYAKSIDAVVPLVNNKHYFKLYNARHPLIDKAICVPNDFILGEDKKLMLISGPNAGGKTISLKTVAVCAYMIKLGFAIPVSIDSDICIFDKIYVEIGDDQSIESNLSTFSAHISNLSWIFKQVSSKDLVIIDEICTGTDPKEGESLAVAMVKYLIKSGALALVTSHYEMLKKYGLTNPEILNASFLFNEKSITPTFKILLGASGKSYGFLISKKFGIDDDIIREAKKNYENSFATEDDKKRKSISEKERYLLEKEQKIKERQSQVQSEKDKLLAKEKALKDQEAALKNQKIDKFDDFLETKYEEVREIYAEFLKDRDVKKAEAKLDAINVKKRKNENIEVGNYISIKHLDLQGRVTQIKGSKITVQTEDGFTINTSKDSCEIIDEPKKTFKSTVNVDSMIMNQKRVSSSLNLVGYHIDEGLAALDKYLDDCTLRNLKEVKIIHGYGSGKLRMAIHDYLKKNKNVKSFRLGTELDGGSGSTIVTLK